MDKPARPELVQRIDITAEMDRHAVEALYLEVRRLAALYGVIITEFRSETLSGHEHVLRRGRARASSTACPEF